ASNGGVALDKNSGNGKFISPLVRSIAQKENISMSEIDAISGTGTGGRVTKKDILSYIDTRGNGGSVAPAAVQTAVAPVVSAPAAPAAAVSGGSSFLSNIKEPIVVPNPGDEIMEMDRMRKLIAEHMVMSKHVSPHVT